MTRAYESLRTGLFELESLTMASRTIKKRNRQPRTKPDALTTDLTHQRRIAVAERRLKHAELEMEAATKYLRRAQKLFDDAMRTP